MIDKKCEICGANFQVSPYREKTARFCSKACGSSWHAQTRLNTGTKPWAVGNKWRQGKPPKNAFTSEQTSGDKNYKWVESISLPCQQCGATFSRKPWVVRQNTPKFCSQKCAQTHNSGANHWGYVGGPNTYRGRSWRKQRLIAVERDNGTCQDCGKEVGKSIPVHHIKPYREFSCEENANHLSNLICLCQSCHMKREYCEALPFSRSSYQSRS